MSDWANLCSNDINMSIDVQRESTCCHGNEKSHYSALAHGWSNGVSLTDRSSDRAKMTLDRDATREYSRDFRVAPALRFAGGGALNVGRCTALTMKQRSTYGATARQLFC